MNQKLDKIINYINESIADLQYLDDVSNTERVLIELHLREIKHFVKSLKE